MEDVMGMLEGWKQIASFMRKSESQTRRILGRVLNLLPHWDGPGTRLKLTPEEVLRLKAEARKLKNRKMNSNERPCAPVSE
jgi:AraC-like DNA-binding protein